MIERCFNGAYFWFLSFRGRSRCRERG